MRTVRRSNLYLPAPGSPYSASAPTEHSRGSAPVSRPRRCSMSWSSGGWPHAFREAPSDSPRRETPSFRTVHPRHSRRPQGACRLDRCRPPALSKRHLHQSRRVDRRGSVYSVRQQPQSGRYRQEARAARGRGRGAVPRERHGSLRAGAPRGVATGGPSARQRVDLWRRLRLFREEFGKLGIDVSFVNPTQQRTWKRAMRKTTRAVFLETPTNPLMRVLDLEPVATVCKAEGLALIVDSTFASPVNFRPLEHGADLVIHSATKYLNGHTDVIAGAVAGTDQVVEEVRRLMQVWGQALDPFAAWLIDRGMRTLTVRVRRQNEIGLAVAEWCAKQDAISKVHYPGLPSHPDHEHAKRILSGFGGMLGIELKGGVRAAERFLRALTIAAHAPSLGGVETLVSEPRLTSHAALSAEDRQRAGIPDGFLRFSLGLEDADDLIADFAHALAQL